MRLVIVGLLLVSARPVLAEPLHIDLTEEKAEYERLSRNRTVGLTMLGVTAAGAGAAIYGYVTAAGARSSLLTQTLPVNVMARQDLVNSGQVSNAIGIIGALVGIAAAALCAYFMVVSF